MEPGERALWEAKVSYREVPAVTNSPMEERPHMLLSSSQQFFMSEPHSK